MLRGACHRARIARDPLARNDVFRKACKGHATADGRLNLNPSALVNYEIAGVQTCKMEGRVALMDEVCIMCGICPLVK